MQRAVGRRSARGSRPRLSVVICTFEMQREAPRTLLSASVPYQKDIGVDEYEVIVVDNGSSTPPEVPAGLPSVRVLRHPSPTPSPAPAMNWGAEQASGDILLFAIDGARIFSDRLYRSVLDAHRRVDDALVYTLAWHIGPAEQMTSSRQGYDQRVEDELIASSGWPDDPDALWKVSVFAGSSNEGFFRPVAESNAFSVPRTLFERLGGYDERYTSPGGGLCNLEIFRRYVNHLGVTAVCLLSEGTFHQFHGGVATSGRVGWDELVAEHRRITGEPDFELPVYRPLYLGPVRPAVVPFLEASLHMAIGTPR